MVTYLLDTFHPAATLEVYLGESKSKEGSMKLPRIVVFLFALVALAFVAPAPAHAQGYWTWGTTGLCGSAYCTSAMAACDAYRAQDSSGIYGPPQIVAFLPNPRLNEYFTCSVEGGID